MKISLKKMLAGFAGAVLATNASAIVISPLADADGLTNTILGNGITFSNASIVGDASQFGTFTGGQSSGLGFNSGIILSSGNVADAVGPNAASGTTTSFGGAGNAQLDGLGAGPTQDAATLQFDFTSDGGNLFFNFIFASEEYNEFVDTQFNDVFAFFVDGINIALAPDGQPASINTVNCGNGFTNPNGPNCASLNNNDTGLFDIEYDGFTDVFTAQVLGLSQGLHTIQISIADVGDAAFDSAVFIQANSFANTPTPVPEPASLALLLLGFSSVAAARLLKSRKV